MVLKFPNLCLNPLVNYRKKKSNFVPTNHHCSIVGHIRPNCSLMRQEPKHVTKIPFRNIDFPKFSHVCHFCGVSSHIRPNYHKLKFKLSVFQSRICDHVHKCRKFFWFALEKFKIVSLWNKILGFLSLSKEFYSS